MGGGQVTNYELGIVMPLKTAQEIDRVACWERPPKKYAIGKDEPWVSSFSDVCIASTSSLMLMCNFRFKANQLYLKRYRVEAAGIKLYIRS